MKTEDEDDLDFDHSIVANVKEIEQVEYLLSQVCSNFTSVRKDWAELETTLDKYMNLEVLNKSEVIIQKVCLQNIVNEAEKIKTLFLTIFAQNEKLASARIQNLESELCKVLSERTEIQADVIHWKSQLDLAVKDVQKEKQEQVHLRSELKELTDKLSEQSEFCCSLGAACCTLLWKISRQESAIETLVSGCKNSEFLKLTCIAVQGYLAAYRTSDWPHHNTDEAKFILSICGIITNVAASSQGREYLASCQEGCEVMNTFISFIGKAPNGKSAQIKILMLMSLYNFSINSKGIKFLCSKRDLIPLLAKHFKEEKDAENQLRTLKLVQSLVCDETCASVCISELLQYLPKSQLQQMSKSSTPDIQIVSLEILSEVAACKTSTDTHKS
ncbi:heat shock factor 2-binding protein [Biomphalaria glabrata]|uniref:Heat shock factor 2-binding protein-like isoform X2 n=1 Tax=Biomphalaria glabrata TaxID=6526 RepID=A0A9W2YD84_BIOGL|nr:heat shock factor 2-binding protein-like isoform X2 [Biomphalaria glabrata]XP_055860680.1 heat shock factor 2-binding protein-like isoform X2 [Biomphalaria glabrata]XP_055860683.1 heat shock factor 2-binding protein-like isoform X2 [Biomphalaria glabrata]XP_055860684.1 heat shock factor 2-binding protein-like isoform X2 [Biomphalaria glabrata]XP_055860685.1 heat shock factor 2-binding protein-like isoform X2 [Biomphalaria glabrata]KAI8730264.1 heat shock factor 2-binding protein-like [Biomp